MTREEIDKGVRRFAEMTDTDVGIDGENYDKFLDSIEKCNPKSESELIVLIMDTLIFGDLSAT